VSTTPTSGGRRFALDSDFIGTLSKILADLRGYDTLAYELIQNADDAKGNDHGKAPATRIRFDVDAQAVTVWNDGEFTWCGADETCEEDQRCDLHSFLLVAGEAKRDRDGTTGAFGVGFTSIYQLTDRPELISPGIHLTLAPEESDRFDRVTSCDGCVRCTNATGTTFRLPWASKQSTLRTRLHIEPACDPAGFVEKLRASLIQAMPFLRRVRTVELRRDDRLVATYTRTPLGDTVHLTGPDGTTVLHRLTGSFAEEEERLRGREGSPIEAKRHSNVTVLVGNIAPFVGHAGAGRLYAGLPTDERIPAQILLAADFFPHSTRKTITLADDHRSDWNRAALQAGAEAVAEALPKIVDALGAARAWELIASFKDTSTPETDRAYQAFWPTIAAAACWKSSERSSPSPRSEGCLAACRAARTSGCSSSRRNTSPNCCKRRTPRGWTIHDAVSCGS
jgi:hypothetical protein